jgi:hypothetical protein
MITILVGEDEHRFTVHKDMLCAKSKFFRAACSERWASGVEKAVRQPEGTAEDFQIYVEWVYTSKISLHTEEIDKQQAKLMDMYILGDVVDDYQLRNASMRRLIANTRKEMTILTSRQVHKVYEATTTGSPLRKFIVNWLLSSFDRDDLKASIASEPAEFVRELALAALQRIEPEGTDEVFETLTRMFEPEKESG